MTLTKKRKRLELNAKENLCGSEMRAEIDAAPGILSPTRSCLFAGRQAPSATYEAGACWPVSPKNSSIRSRRLRRRSSRTRPTAAHCRQNDNPTCCGAPPVGQHTPQRASPLEGQRHALKRRKPSAPIAPPRVAGKQRQRPSGPMERW